MNSNTQLGCGCDKSQLYNPFKIMDIKSQILDFNTALPIENVNVYKQNNPNKGTITNANGFFQLDAMPDDVIVFSHVAYGNITVPAKDVLPVEYLQEEAGILDEVVVIAKKKKNWVFAALATIGIVLLVYSSSDDEKKPTPKKAVKVKV
ncbi:carboxypeptidase-like regulatory domain-containing protein [Algibacter sp. PT7-4]|uniref:carboxypeptidase-like regulatory domain-containing protein n=1 Tax=Algibacter ulvanivorans TaxID=3400999 RepID=UPI003AB0BC6B